MIGAIIGDIAGSRFEFNNIRNKKFNLFDAGCNYTDDTILTIAVADAIINKKDFGTTILEYAKAYQHPMGGYGASFQRWVYSDNHEPYNSFGNGSAMRVSPCVLLADTRAKALQYAACSAIATHNHPEGVKGAMAIVDSAWMAKSGYSKKEITMYIESNYGYDLNQSYRAIQKSNVFNETCQVTVPLAIISFLYGKDFEDCIKTAISIGGDSDTIAAMTGTIAEAFYGIPEDIKAQAMTFLPQQFINIINQEYTQK